MTRANTKLCGVCQSLFADGPCIHAPGAGAIDDPVVPDFNLDPAEGNLLSKGPNGLMGRLPPIYLDPPAALVYDSVDQPISFDTLQVLEFARRGYDTDNMWDPDQSSQLVFRTPGLYLVTINVCWWKHELDGVLGDTMLFLRTNGDLIVAVDSQPPTTSSGFARQSLHAVIPVQTAGEFVQALVESTLRVDAETPLNARVLAVRQSPIFTATYLRSLDDLVVFGR